MESYYINCVNCGKETLMDGTGPDELCQFCRKPASRKIKEVGQDSKPVLKTADPCPPPKEVTQGSGWYKSHKKEMIEDLITMGYDAFLEKWKVKRQIISHLKSDKLYKSKVPAEIPRAEKTNHCHKGPPSLEAVVEGLKPKRTKELPEFPEFNEQWTELVKVKWIEAYQALKEVEVKQ
jgi:hypothetical protein